MVLYFHEFGGCRRWIVGEELGNGDGVMYTEGNRLPDVGDTNSDWNPFNDSWITVGETQSINLVCYSQAT